MMTSPVKTRAATVMTREEFLAILSAIAKDATEIDLSNKNPSLEQLQELCEALKNNTSLTSLNLSNDIFVSRQSGIKTAGAKVIADLLKHNKTLKKLILSGNAIAAEGAIAIAEVLKENRSLQILNISSNKIGDEGTKAIMNAIKLNTALLSLNLYFNNIGMTDNSGATAIAEVLKQNTTLQTMNLGANRLWIEGGKIIASALKENKDLKILVLTNNGLEDEGTIAIMEALKDNHSLHTLHLQNNRFGEKALQAIADVLSHNKTLHTLGHIFLGEYTETIELALKANKARLVNDEEIKEKHDQPTFTPARDAADRMTKKTPASDLVSEKDRQVMANPADLFKKEVKDRLAKRLDEEEMIKLDEILFDYWKNREPSKGNFPIQTSCQAWENFMFIRLGNDRSRAAQFSSALKDAMDLAEAKLKIEDMMAEISRKYSIV